MNIKLRIFLTLTSAGLAVLVFPPIAWAPLAVIAWIPLLLALRGTKASHALYLGILHGAIFYGVTMSWLWDVFAEARWLFAPLIMIMALFTGMFARGFSVACSRYGMGWVTPVFASIWWLGVEFFRCDIFYLKFPWMTPGMGLGPTWLSPIIGVHGASLLVIFGAALMCSRRRQSVVGSVILSLMLVSAWWQGKREVSAADTVRVAAVQSESIDIDQYEKLTRATAVDKPDIIIWPEHSLPIDLRRNKYQWPQMLKLAKETESILVVGTRTDHESGGWYNTALTFNGEGVLGEHFKNHPVHFFDDGVAGTEAKAVATPVGKTGTPICFDSDYQDVIRRMVSDGAEFLTIPSMDAIHWGEKEHYQHAELFRHRAAENGRWIMVAASSGMTQVLDPNGNRVAELPIIDQGVLTYELGKSNDVTIYNRAGWLLPWAAMGIAILWVIWIGVQMLLEKKKA
ncbi:MAG: apolipoprotein N-acyltransferase [Akkermansiaceae bacterium]